MALPLILLEQRATYDAEVDAAYLYLVDEIADGAATTQRVVEVPGVGDVVLDFDDDDRLLGMEVIAASALLPRDLLDRLTAGGQTPDEQASDDLAPVNLLHGPVADWLRARGPHAEALADQVAWSPTFTEQSFPGGPGEVEDLWTTGGRVSWVGGPAVAPLDHWPRSAARAPLEHVITVCLDDLHTTGDAASTRTFPQHEQGLPTTGALEVFHDLSTWGWDADDAAAAGWLVRWVPQPDRSHLVPGPDTTALDGRPSSPVCQAGTFLPGWTLPPLADAVGAPSAVFDVAEDLAREHARAWCHQRQLPFRGQVDGPTHAYGHGSRSTAAAAEVLAAVLPLDDGDHHRLLLEVESGSHLAGWFGDRGHLQVWMRRSDLAARRFDAAWCLVRTD